MITAARPEPRVPITAAADVAEAITLSANIDIQAADSAKPATFGLVAYTGGVIRVPAYFDDVVIDLAGMKAAGSIPLLADHVNALEAVLGAGEAEIDAARAEVRMRGQLVRGTLAADHCIKLAAAGVRLQVSVGAMALRSEFVTSGTSVSVNGKSFQGPLRVVRQSELREVSIVAIGADPGTSVKVAATHQGNAMPPPANSTNSPSTADPARAERERILEIRRITAAGGLPSELQNIATNLEAKAIAGEISIASLGAEMVQLLRSSRPSGQSSHGSPAGRGSDHAEVLAAAVMLHAGFGPAAERVYGEQLLQRAADLRCRSLLDICAAALVIDGRHVPSGRSEMIQASFSTMSLPVALGSSMDKILVQSFEAEEPTWRSIARQQNLRNFRAAPTVRSYLTGQLQEVAPDGELKYVSIGEALGEIQADTFGAVIGITRKDIINDDLGVFEQISSMLGIAASRRMSDDCYTLLLSNPSSFFDAANGNYFSGAASALSVTSLSTAVAMLRNQTDENGRPLNLKPATLLVAPKMETTARGILHSDELGYSTGTPTGNPLKGIANLEVEPRLSNALFPGYSELAWYLFAQRQTGALMVGYIDNATGPHVDFFGLNTDADRLGLSWRVYHDFGFALNEPRGVVKAKGEV